MPSPRDPSGDLPASASQEAQPPLARATAPVTCHYHLPCPSSPAVPSLHVTFLCPSLQHLRLACLGRTRPRQRPLHASNSLTARSPGLPGQGGAGRCRLPSPARWDPGSARAAGRAGESAPECTRIARLLLGRPRGGRSSRTAGVLPLPWPVLATGETRPGLAASGGSLL